MNRPDLFDDRLERAIRRAAAAHRHQERRGSGVPYIAHPFAVAWIVERAGYDGDAVVAALLHDVVEDTPTTLDEIRAEFGAGVAAIVAGCSEVKLDAAGRPLPWEVRKRDHLRALGSADEVTRAVVLADKLHNLRSIALDLAAGLPVWDGFHAARDRVLWYFDAVLAACRGAEPRSQALAVAGWRELDRVRASSAGNPDSTTPTT